MTLQPGISGVSADRIELCCPSGSATIEATYGHGLDAEVKHHPSLALISTDVPPDYVAIEAKGDGLQVRILLGRDGDTKAPGVGRAQVWIDVAALMPFLEPAYVARIEAMTGRLREVHAALVAVEKALRS